MQPSRPASSSRGVVVGVYLALLAAGILAFFAIRAWGLGLTAPAAPEGATLVQNAAAPESRRVDVVFHVLATLAAVLALGQFFSYALRRFHQPAVIGEVAAGIVLGPSVLGAVSPETMHLLIPDAAGDPHRLVVTALQVVAQLGVVLYMFLVGLELNPRKLGPQAQTAVAISHASIVAPFVSGAALALWLYPRLSHSGVPFTSFALFLGVAMSITAFPVLARILTDQKLSGSTLGVVALSCAAVDDVTAWCLLALVVGVAQSRIDSALAVVAGAVAFILTMIVVIRPLAVQAARWFESRPARTAFHPWVCAAVLLAALATEAIGIHAVFGAFLLGAVLPHDSRLAQELRDQLQGMVTTLLLPAFFALTGMNTQIGLIAGAQDWLICLVIILVATAGKFGGTALAARLTGHDWRSAAALGVLMNTRGLMELIVLNIGLSLGVISPTLYAMMVLMALATTWMTSPLLARLLVAAPAADVPSSAPCTTA